MSNPLPTPLRFTPLSESVADEAVSGSLLAGLDRDLDSALHSAYWALFDVERITWPCPCVAGCAVYDLEP